MAERGSGKIINIGSVQSMLARETIAPYAAAKGGLVMLTKGMAADLARHNVQVNAISPGYFATEMNQALVADEAFRLLGGRPDPGPAVGPGRGEPSARCCTSPRTPRASSPGRTSSSTAG